LSRFASPRQRLRRLEIGRGARIAIALALSAATTSASASPPQHLSRADLCVTEGAIDELPLSHELSVDSPKMRAYVITQPVRTIAARFTYLGATSHDVPLGSGTMRRQFGLKLRAQDACNLVYAMWRIEPESKLVVSIKENPGQRLSAECGNRGYRNIRPLRSAPTPRLRPDEAHTLRAEMTPTTISIYIDEMLAWQGLLSSDVLKWDERAGIRSDNVRARFDLTVPTVVSTGSENCKAERSDAE
jgi:hypothetical protein